MSSAVIVAPPRERVPPKQSTGHRVEILRALGATWPEVAEILGCPGVVAISALRWARQLRR